MEGGRFVTVMASCCKATLLMASYKLKAMQSIPTTAHIQATSIKAYVKARVS